jgi:DNA-binding CsgD family transcriptional regulator
MVGVVADTATGPALLERGRDLEKLGAALADARGGEGRIVMIEAPAGLGKTSLIRAAGDLAAEAGYTVLRARATELERDFAYGCVRRLLEPAVLGREDLFEGAAAMCHRLFEPDSIPRSPQDAESAATMLHGLYWLVSNLSDVAPVALAVDDLQWADTESLHFLNYLAPRLDGIPVAVVAGARSGEGLRPDLARLSAAPEATVLRLAPLSDEATAVLCERRLGPGVAPEFARACREASGGNPFFLEELLREAAQGGLPTDAGATARIRHIGPATVAQAVLLRLSGRPGAAPALVRAVAVLGDGTTLAEAAELAGLAADDSAAAADLLVALEVLRAAGGLEFTHPIVREAVYADIGAYERAQAHARAATLLGARGATEERVAAQIAAADPVGDAERVALLRRVAAGALARGAPAAAVTWLRRALAEPPPPEAHVDVLLELGGAEHRIGAPEAPEHLAAAVDRIEDPQRLATSVRLLANALTISGDPDGAVRALDSAIAVVESRDRELALVLEAELATHAQQASPETRAPAARRLVRHGDLQGATRGERLVLASLAFERAKTSESAEEAARRLEEALDGGRLVRELELDIAGPLYDIVIALLHTDALDVAAASLDEALDRARATASAPATAYLTSRRGWIALRRGAIASAERSARTALELLANHGIRLGVPLATALLVRSLVESGDLDAAEQALRDSGIGDELRPGLTGNFLLEARALLRLAQGRPRDGLDDLLEFGRRHEQWGGANPLASRWGSRAALALAALDDDAEARRLAAGDLERAERWGAATGIGIALHATALVEGGSRSVELLTRAAGVLERSPSRLEHARALVDLGAALRRANRRAEARVPLTHGLEIAERCAAGALEERARTELLASGGRVSDPYLDGANRLTVSERRVAELAAEGRSNPEIAQALFVTRKTVETHLGSVYRKLDIAGRGELARALG